MIQVPSMTDFEALKFDVLGLKKEVEILKQVSVSIKQVSRLDASNMLSVSVQTIDKLCKSGDLVYVKSARKVNIEMQSIIDYMRKMSIKVESIKSKIHGIPTNDNRRHRKAN
jgi:DNA-binding Xre family transcriptional regulator